MTAPSKRDRRVRIYAYSDADQGKTGIVTPLYIFQQEVWAQVRPISGDERTTAAQAQRTERCMFLLERSVSVPRNGLIMIKATGTLWRVQAVLSRYEKALQQVEGFLVDDAQYPRNDQTVFINATVGMAGAGELGTSTSVSTGFFAAALAGMGEVGVGASQNLASVARAAGGGADAAAAGISGVAAVALESTGSQLSFAKETITGVVQEAGSGADAASAAITTQVTAALAGGGSDAATGQETIPATVAEAGGGAENAAAGIQGLVTAVLASMGVVSAAAVETITGAIQEASGGSIAASAGAPGTFRPNMPAGMTIVWDTGNITNAVSQVSGGSFSSGGPVPLSVTNLSPNTPSSVGEFAGNLSNTPGGGMRVTYATNLHGGNSPVRMSIASYAQAGTGKLYMAWQFTLSSGFGFSTATGIKICEPHTTVTGNNHVVALNCQNDAGNKDGVSGYPMFLLQGNHTGDIPGAPQGFPAPNSVFGTQEALANFGGPSRGTTKLFEILLEQETPINTGINGQVTFWVNGTQVFTTHGGTPGGGTGIPSAGITFDAGGWPQLLFDPTYGGDADTDRPPAGTFWDINNITVAVA